MYISRAEHKWILKSSLLAVNIAMSYDVYYKLYVILVVIFSTLIFKLPIRSSSIFTSLPLMGILIEGFIWRMVLYQGKVTQELLVTCARLAVNIPAADPQFIVTSNTLALKPSISILMLLDK